METNPPKLSPTEFATKVKEKYPEYKDVDDIELTEKVLAKYPEYAEIVDLKKKEPSSPISTEESKPLPTGFEKTESLAPSKRPVEFGGLQFDYPAGKQAERISPTRKTLMDTFESAKDEMDRLAEINARIDELQAQRSTEDAAIKNIPLPGGYPGSEGAIREGLRFATHVGRGFDDTSKELSRLETEKTVLEKKMVEKQKPVMDRWFEAKGFNEEKFQSLKQQVEGVQKFPLMETTVGFSVAGSTYQKTKAEYQAMAEQKKNLIIEFDKEYQQSIKEQTESSIMRMAEIEPRIKAGIEMVEGFAQSRASFEQAWADYKANEANLPVDERKKLNEFFVQKYDELEDMYLEAVAEEQNARGLYEQYQKDSGFVQSAPLMRAVGGQNALLAAEGVTETDNEFINFKRAFNNWFLDTGSSLAYGGALVASLPASAVVAITPDQMDGVLGEVRGRLKTAIENVTSDAAGAAELLEGRKQHIYPLYQPNIGDGLSFGEFMVMAGQVIPEVISNVAISIPTGGAGVGAYNMIRESGAMYKDLTEQGIGVEEAVPLATNYGVAAGMLERYGFERAIRPFKGRYLRGLLDVAAEGGTEALQAVAEDITKEVSDIVGNRDNFAFDLRDQVKSWATEGAMGVMGGVMFKSFGLAMGKGGKDAAQTVRDAIANPELKATALRNLNDFVEAGLIDQATADGIIKAASDVEMAMPSIPEEFDDVAGELVPLTVRLLELSKKAKMVPEGLLPAVQAEINLINTEIARVAENMPKKEVAQEIEQATDEQVDDELVEVFEENQEVFDEIESYFEEDVAEPDTFIDDEMPSIEDERAYIESLNEIPEAELTPDELAAKDAWEQADQQRLKAEARMEEFEVVGDNIAPFPYADFVAMAGDVIDQNDRAFMKQFFDDTRQPLDTMAQEASGNAGKEITPQDVVDFILEKYQMRMRGAAVTQSEKKSEQKAAEQKIKTSDKLREMAARMSEIRKKLDSDGGAGPLSILSSPAFMKVYEGALAAAEVSLQGAAKAVDIYNAIMDSIRKSDFWSGLNSADQKAVEAFVRDEAGYKPKVVEQREFRNTRLRINQINDRLQRGMNPREDGDKFKPGEQDKLKAERNKLIQRLFNLSQEIGKDLPITGLKDTLDALKVKEKAKADKRVEAAKEKATEQKKDRIEKLKAKHKEELERRGLDRATILEMINELTERVAGAASVDLVGESEARADYDKVSDSSEKQAEKDLSGIKNDLVPDHKRESVTIDRRSVKETLERGKALVDSGTINPDVLMQSLISKPRPMTADEIAIMVYYKAMLDGQSDSLYEQMEKAVSRGDGEMMSAIDLKLSDVESKIDLYHTMSLETGYEQGLSLRMRQLLINREYDLANQVRKFKRQTKRSSVPADVMARFRVYEEAIKELNKRIKEVSSQIDESEGKLEVLGEDKSKRQSTKDAAKELAKKVRKIKFTKTYADLSRLQSDPTGLFKVAWDGAVEVVAKIIEGGGAVATAVERGVEYIKKTEWYKALSAKGKAEAEALARKGLYEQISSESKGVMPEMRDGALYIPNDFIVELIKSGFDTIEAATAEALRIIKELDGFDGVNERQVRDAISDYGKQSKLSKEDVAVKLREMKRVGKLLSALEDVQKQKRPKRSGRERDALTQKERELNKEIKELLKDIPQDSAEVESAWKSALDAVKKRYKNRIEDLEKQIATGEKTKKRKPIELDAEAQYLKEEVERLRAVLRSIEGKPELSFEQRVRIAESALEANIKEYQRRIDEKDFEPIKKQPISTPKIEALKKKRQELKEKYKLLKDGPPKTAEEKLNDAAAKRIEKQIQSTVDLINGVVKDDAKKSTPIYSAEVIRLQQTLFQLREQLKQTQAYKDSVEQKRIDSAIDRAVKTIKEYQRKIAESDFSTQQKTPISNSTVDGLKNVIDDLKNEYRLLKDGPPKTAQEKVDDRELARLKKEIEKVQGQINGEIDIESKKQAKIEYSAHVLIVQERLKNLRDELKETEAYRELAEKKRLENVKKLARKAINNYEERIKNRDFAVKKPTQVKLDEEAKKLKVEQQRWKNKFDLEREKQKLKDRTRAQKFVDGIIDVLGVMKTFKATLDLSAPFRQGLLLTTRRPTSAVRAFGQMFKQAFSEAKYEAWMDELVSSEEYVYMRRAGLYVSMPNAVLLAKEEQFVSNIAEKIPLYKFPVRASNRAYSAYLNAIRVYSFNAFHMNLKNMGLSEDQMEKELKFFAKFINNASGRGNLGSWDATDKAASMIFFAPKYVVSRFNIVGNTVTGYASYPPQARKEALKTVLSYASVLGLVMALAVAAGADVEEDPRSPDFGKIRFGKLRYDLGAGFLQPIRLLATIFSKSKKRLSGEVVPLNEDSFKSNTADQEVVRFFRTKMAPAPGMAWDYLAAPRDKTKEWELFGDTYENKVYFKNVVGEEQTMPEKAIEAVSPLYISDVKEVVEAEGVYMIAPVAIPALFGVGVQYYDEPEEK